MNDDIMERTEKDWLDWLLKKGFVSEVKPAALNTKYRAEYGRILQVVGSTWAMILSRLERYQSGEYEPVTELPPWLRRQSPASEDGTPSDQKRNGQRGAPAKLVRRITDKDEVAAMFQKMDEKAAMKLPAYRYGLVRLPSQKSSGVQSKPAVGKSVQDEMKGVDEMAKGRKTEEPPTWRSDDEVMASVMEECKEVGRVLSERALKKHRWLDYKEIVAVIGKGDPRLAMEKINQKWKELHPKTEEPKEVQQQAAGKDPGRRFGELTAADLLKMVQASQADHGLAADQMPTSKQFLETLDTHIEFPAMNTLYKRFGKMSDWEVVLRRAGLWLEEVIPEEVVSEENAAEEIELKEVTPEEIVAEPAKKRIRLKVTIESLYQMVREIQEHCGLTPDRYPTDAQIKAYSKEHRDRCPSHVTFYNNLGPRANWAQKFREVGLIESEISEMDEVPVQAKAEEADDVFTGGGQLVADDELMEVFANDGSKEKSIDVLVRSATLDVVIGGQNWKLNLKFGTE